MKRGTPQHPKMTALALALQIPRYAAVGLLESLWHFCAEFTPAGDVGRYSDTHISNAIGWEGKPAALMRALAKTGWLEKHPECRLVVHDWSEHADDSVKMRLLRAKKFFADGKFPLTTRIGKAECDQIRGEMEGSRAHAVLTPCSLPHPTPAPPHPTIALASPAPHPTPATSEAGAEPAPAAEGGWERGENIHQGRGGNGIGIGGMLKSAVEVKNEARGDHLDERAALRDFLIEVGVGERTCSEIYNAPRFPSRAEAQKEWSRIRRSDRFRDKVGTLVGCLRSKINAPSTTAGNGRRHYPTAEERGEFPENIEIPDL